MYCLIAVPTQGLSIPNVPDGPFWDPPADQAFLQQVSEQVALALESARLSEQTQIALARTDELYGVSQTMNEAATEAEILEALTRPAVEAGAFSANLLYLDLDEVNINKSFIFVSPIFIALSFFKH